jgi:hypothetical protein
MRRDSYNSNAPNLSPLFIHSFLDGEKHPMIDELGGETGHPSEYLLLSFLLDVACPTEHKICHNKGQPIQSSMGKSA